MLPSSERANATAHTPVVQRIPQTHKWTVPRTHVTNFRPKNARGKQDGQRKRQIMFFVCWPSPFAPAGIYRIGLFFSFNVDQRGFPCHISPSNLRVAGIALRTTKWVSK